MINQNKKNWAFFIWFTDFIRSAILFLINRKRDLRNWKVAFWPRNLNALEQLLYVTRSVDPCINYLFLTHDPENFLIAFPCLLSFFLYLVYIIIRISLLFTYYYYFSLREFSLLHKIMFPILIEKADKCIRCWN